MDALVMADDPLYNDVILPVDDNKSARRALSAHFQMASLYSSIRKSQGNRFAPERGPIRTTSHTPPNATMSERTHD
jgi:hypothetical protein